MSCCGPQVCGYLWHGVDAAYMHTCSLPADPPHREHVCDEGVVHQPPPFLPPQIVGNDRLGHLLAEAINQASKPKRKAPPPIETLPLFELSSHPKDVDL